MFKVEFLVDDNKLSKVMWELDGVAYDFKIAPVKGAKATATGIKSTLPASSVGLTQAVVDRLQSWVGPLAYLQLRDIYVEVGGTKEAVGNLIVRLIARKVIKRISTGNFVVLGPGMSGLRRKSVAKPGTAYLASLNGENLVAKVAKLIKEQNLNLLSLDDVGTLSTEAGGSRNSNYFLIAQLQRHGVIQKTDDGNYEVIN